MFLDYPRLIRRFEGQDGGEELLSKLDQHIDNFLSDLVDKGFIEMSDGGQYTNTDWVEEFFESEDSIPVIRFLYNLAENENLGLPPEIALILKDFREKWVCELAAVDAQIVLGEQG